MALSFLNIIIQIRRVIRSRIFFDLKIQTPLQASTPINNFFPGYEALRRNLFAPTQSIGGKSVVRVSKQTTNYLGSNLFVNESNFPQNHISPNPKHS
ncbi:MAG: hypothetical protein CL670_01835 [Balneola sp.]|jgi:hypothetical protein|nr:hypothetical protein [Balneola sp.]MBE77876.1 hypothetical protein [Balneola sp.]HBX65447.1 hypothetical protein [Balneolaceae bacterium]|tara:strand:+ start:201 stop:491 length:291 start_codon:yes stop_codon:yes gene_type:complete